MEASRGCRARPAMRGPCEGLNTHGEWFGLGCWGGLGGGAHCHLDGGERAYRFTTVEAPVEDFIAAVDAARSKP